MEKHDQESKKAATIFPLAIAHLAGLGALQLAIVLFFFDPHWTTIPLGGFLLACLIAPFVQRLQFFLPIVTRGSRRSGAVALTFDDGPDPLTTPQLMKLLADHNVKATFFVVGSEVRKHPELLHMILDQGHEIGNHSGSHDVFLMFRGLDYIRREITECQETLAAFGIRPVAFRPPVGVTNPRLWRVLLESGLYCAGFRRRARDIGNRRVRGLSRRILRWVKPGDIILLHDREPFRRSDAGVWLQEIDRLIHGLEQKGLEIKPLSRLIHRPVMEPLSTCASNPVRTYFDSVAHQDINQQQQGRRPVARRIEGELFAEFAASIKSENRILEVGTGTGRFTIPLARKASEVWAVDVSPGALAILGNRAQEKHVDNIQVVLADIRQFKVPGRFDVICSISAFEYIPDLLPLLQQLVSHLKPGGRLYFITAHRSLFRFFTQTGNAMRQGLWLHARTRPQILKMLHSLDMEAVVVTTHGMKSLLNSGLLLEVSATKKKGQSQDPKTPAQLPRGNM